MPGRNVNSGREKSEEGCCLQTELSVNTRRRQSLPEAELLPLIPQRKQRGSIERPGKYISCSLKWKVEAWEIYGGINGRQSAKASEEGEGGEAIRGGGRRAM